MDYKTFKSIEFKVGLFVISTLLSIIMTVGYIAYKKDIFAKSYNYKLISKSGEHIIEGMSVLFSGFTVGKVSSIELDNGGTVIITISIQEKYKEWIRVDSRFIIDKPLIGSPRIIIETNNLTSPLLTQNSKKAVYIRDGINDIITKAQPVVDELQSIVNNINKITANISDDNGNLNKILKNTERFSGDLAKNGVMDSVIKDKSSIDAIKLTIRSSNELISKVDKILQNVDDITKNTNGELFKNGGMFDNTNRSLNSVSEILIDLSNKLKKAEPLIDNTVKISNDAVNISSEINSSSKDIKLLRNEIDLTINRLNLLISEINRKLPLKGEKEIKLP